MFTVQMEEIQLVNIYELSAYEETLSCSGCNVCGTVD
jgi:hypothetical protein